MAGHNVADPLQGGPGQGQNAVFIDFALAGLGLRGAAMDPYLVQIYANDAKYYPVYSKCCELDIPIIFTTGPATLVPSAIIDHVAPRCIDVVARDFPELKMIISHGGYSWVNEAITVAERNKNVHIDLSEYEFSPMAEAYVQAANTMIAAKILYASAHPFVHFKDALNTYQKLELKPEVRQKIMHDNAAKLLGLTHSAPSVATGNVDVQNLLGDIVREVMSRLKA